MGGDTRPKKQRFFKMYRVQIHKLSMTGQPKGGCRYYKRVDSIPYKLSMKEHRGNIKQFTVAIDMMKGWLNEQELHLTSLRYPDLDPDPIRTKA